MNDIINLEPKNFYTQRNNHLHPSSACMPTARVMFYIGNGIEYKNPTSMADDDYFMSILRSDEAWELAKEKYPNLIASGFAPNEIHGMYHSYLDRKVVGYRTSDFVSNLTWDEILFRIRNGEVIMTSGKFPGLDGHAFDFIGSIENELEASLRIADPWGDFHTGYRSHKGYAIPMSKDDFKKHVKPTKDIKWGHICLKK